MIKYIILFIVGSFFGMVIEFFFHSLRQKKFVNPGMLTVPFLPLYGFAVVVLYLVSDLSINLFYKGALFLIVTTLFEYIGGLIFIKLLKINLWDYSANKYNLQGLICPLYSLFWLVLSLVFYYFIYPPLRDNLEFLVSNEFVINFSLFILGFITVDFLYHLIKHLRIVKK